MSAPRRCAIYTRKSTEEGLEQDFNSLDAQREACEAYIRSQAGEGWKLVRSHYDDGGYSGGTMDRPALQYLLDDIRARRIDTVVVYKVDRLTRSLADFAKIVEVFDGHGISFVSVTQQFNTTTSMGRLTLNMLLSFAQFEREVTGERIRDKIAASKKKGMWMGGPPPLGYDVRGRKLVINEVEADEVRRLFDLYLNLGTVRRLKEEADRLGITTKRRRRNDGLMVGGRSFSRGNLYRLLSNPLYIGHVAHKGETYPGQHQAIVEGETWDAVQAQLARNAVVRNAATNAKTPSLLAGLAFDEAGERLCPTHANKKGRRYRYYISKRMKHGTGSDGAGWRIPADALDGAVRSAVEMLLRDEHRVVEEMQKAGIPVERIRLVVSNQALLPTALEDRSVLHRILRRVTLGQKSVRLEIDRAEFIGWVSGMPPGSFNVTDKTLEHEVPIRLQRRGVETKLVVRGKGDFEARIDPRLIAHVARGLHWFEELAGGMIGSVNEIAIRDGIDASDVGRSLNLAFLAPDIVAAILAGRQPVELTTRRLRRIGPLPIDWVLQRRLLGFNA